MITSRAKKIAVLASIYCLLAVVVLAGSIYYTEQNKNKFADVRNRNAEARAMQELSTSIEHTLRLSEDDRQELSSFFISERDTIHFITKVETLAKTMQVNVETTQLSVVPKNDKTPSRLEIGFIVEGNYSNVAKMLSAIETLPYHKEILQIAITKSSEKTWEGAVALYVTLQ